MGIDSDFYSPGDNVHTKRTGKVNKPTQQGGTVSNNGPVGSAGNPASTDASSRAMPFGRRGKAPDQKKSGAIERRIAMMNKKGKK